jgi:hypothetical protein
MKKLLELTAILAIVASVQGDKKCFTVTTTPVPTETMTGFVESCDQKCQVIGEKFSVISYLKNYISFELNNLQSRSELQLQALLTTLQGLEVQTTEYSDTKDLCGCGSELEVFDFKSAREEIMSYIQS